MPDTFDLQAKTAISAEDREYWLMVLKSLTAGVAERARDSELEDPDDEEHEKSTRTSLDDHHAFVNYDAYDFESNNNYRKRTPSERAEQFRNAYGSLLDRLLKDPFGCGKISLSSLFEAREECLRDCGFADAYADVKQRENDAALVVLPELLDELEQMEDENQRLIQIVEGVLAGNVFDWGVARHAWICTTTVPSLTSTKRRGKMRRAYRGKSTVSKSLPKVILKRRIQKSAHLCRQQRRGYRPRRSSVCHRTLTKRHGSRPRC